MKWGRRWGNFWGADTITYIRAFTSDLSPNAARFRWESDHDERVTLIYRDGGGCLQPSLDVPR
jgi:hypothetical protein